MAGTVRHAKAQVRGTFREQPSPADTALSRLIARRSQVQILPRHLPLTTLTRDTASILDRGRPVIVCCRDGLWEIVVTPPEGRLLGVVRRP